MKKLILFSFAFVFLTGFTKAQWQQTSLDSTIVRALAINGSNIFAGSDYHSVSLSTDNGTSWTEVNTGLTSTHSMSLIISGTNVITGTPDGVFVSSNNGASWLSTNLTSIASSFVICGTTIFAGCYGGVFKSNDNGLSWSATSLTTNVYSLAVSGNTIFAGADEDTEMFFSTDNGTNWTATGLEGYNVFVLAVCGPNIFASVGGGGVFMSSNNGASWTLVTNVPDILSYAVSGNNFFVGTSDGVYVSTDNGLSWNAWNSNLTSTWVLSLALSGTDIYAGTYGSGVWKRPLSELSGIQEINENGSITVFPNPVSDYITIESPEKSVIEIFNIQGQLMKVANANENFITIDISSFAKGLYIIKVKSENDITARKIIKN
jgi:hypothetical protein